MEFLSREELLRKYSGTLDSLQSEEESEAAICAIASAMPLFIRLLADIRDVLIDGNKD